MKFVINIFKTDIEQTNSTICKCILESDGKFSICKRTAIDDLDIRIYLSIVSFYCHFVYLFTLPDLLN